MPLNQSREPAEDAESPAKAGLSSGPRRGEPSIRLRCIQLRFAASGHSCRSGAATKQDCQHADFARRVRAWTPPIPPPCRPSAARTAPRPRPRRFARALRLCCSGARQAAGLASWARPADRSARGHSTCAAVNSVLAAVWRRGEAAPSCPVTRAVRSRRAATSCARRRRPRRRRPRVRTGAGSAASHIGYIARGNCGRRS